ncbi:MAG: hypothetical protein HOY71_07905, partial [Nonomuraea sp.]|nr:hypothetical protein [Nonomuraea sp.]
ERTLRELRPHQREVLLLCEVCRLERAELAWVLDVAVDTADELAVSAGHRFRQTLETALASTGARVPKPVADVYGALGVAPPRDILGRLPWPAPPPSLRFHFAGSRTAPAAPLFVKPLWPVPPTWPLPLGESDPATSTGLFPTELLTPPAPHPAHEETTAPMPKIGYRPTPRMMPLSAPVPADVLDDDPVTQDLPAIGDVLVASAAPGSLFRPPPREPVYRMPEPVAEEPPPVVAEPAPEPVVRRPIRVRKERHYDWAWELIGFLACVAIALAVFFSIPSIVHP